mmetsp:Transcript_17678/g.31447  ORF Transcript_17678/g.31447 Transcript_17678/m.31447 type:complete len:343 (-) Transcript_17678:787-1815(-)
MMWLRRTSCCPCLRITRRAWAAPTRSSPEILSSSTTGCERLSMLQARHSIKKTSSHQIRERIAQVTPRRRGRGGMHRLTTTVSRTSLQMSPSRTSNELASPLSCCPSRKVHMVMQTTLGSASACTNLGLRFSSMASSVRRVGCGKRSIAAGSGSTQLRNCLRSMRLNPWRASTANSTRDAASQCRHCRPRAVGIQHRRCWDVLTSSSAGQRSSTKVCLIATRQCLLRKTTTISYSGACGQDDWQCHSRWAGTGRSGDFRKYPCGPRSAALNQCDGLFLLMGKACLCRRTSREEKASRRPRAKRRALRRDQSRAVAAPRTSTCQHAKDRHVWTSGLQRHRQKF